MNSWRCVAAWDEKNLTFFLLPEIPQEPSLSLTFGYSIRIWRLNSVTRCLLMAVQTPSLPISALGPPRVSLGDNLVDFSTRTRSRQQLGLE